jgi:hypothetical protein|tara:strand:- start:320 stop:775 length:456 start_codon:yes stop_codon:yes gene_type:complete
MIIISHRGNIEGPNPDCENHPAYIVKALEQGFDVEIDLWKTDQLYLGHSKPTYEVDEALLAKNSKSLWIHCKNLEALLYCKNMKWHCYWHTDDFYTLTSMGYVWAHPNANDYRGTIMVMPEKNDEITNPEYYKAALGVCTDYPQLIMSIKK